MAVAKRTPHTIIIGYWWQAHNKHVHAVYKEKKIYLFIINIIKDI